MDTRRMNLRQWKILVALISAAVAILGGWCAYSFGHLTDTVSWDCGGGSCATNDLVSLFMPAAFMSTLAACVFGAWAMGLIAPALFIAVTSWAFRSGVQAAIADGYTSATSVGFEMTVSLILFIVAGLCFLGWIPMFINNRQVARKVRERAAGLSN